jgi:hypothetical protein
MWRGAVGCCGAALRCGAAFLKKKKNAKYINNNGVLQSF